MTPSDYLAGVHEIYIELAFPALRHDEYQITSAATHDYNCIAWAAEDDLHWWEPSGLGGTYWPVTPLAGAAAFALSEYVRAYESRGYEACASGELEPGFQKIAILALPNGWVTHASRQQARRKLDQ